jgi:HEAT repeat protein
MTVADEAVGKRTRCSKCKHVFRIEVPARAEAVAVEPKKEAAPPPAEPVRQRREKPRESEDRQRRKKKKMPRVYVAVQYPAWLGILSCAWALVGWALASLAPHLAFAPLVGVLNYTLPTVTVALILANLYLAVQNLWRGAHPLALLLVTGLQMGLFTTLFFQLFAHFGAALYDVQGPTSAWQWVGFSLAHALRAWDVLDVIEAYSLNVQMIRHDGWLVALFVILYHVVVDVFFLGVVWDLVERIKRDLLEDDGIRRLVRNALIAAFALWFIAWVTIAFGVRRWSLIDVPLWFVENFLRVLDFADIMESFDLSLHGLPREGWTGTLTFFCRLWIAIGIGLLLGSKKKETERRIATPPEADALAYWSSRAGILAAGLLVVLASGFLWEKVLADPLPRLTAEVAGPSEDRAGAALGALRRLGPTAEAAIPALAAARSTAPGGTRDEITRTLGYLGTKAIDPLAEIALGEGETSAGIAVQSLGRIKPEAAPALVRVWSATPSEEVRQQAAARLHRFGSEAVPRLMAETTAANAETHYPWFAELDRNWRLRATTNPVARALKNLPDLLQQLKDYPDPAATVKIFQGLQECGSAAKPAVAAVIDHLRDRAPKVQESAETLLTALGPTVTPALLRRVDLSELQRQDLTRGPQQLGPELRILSYEVMWDEAALKDEKAVPILAALLGASKTPDSTRRMALRTLGKGGPAAMAVVPRLVPLLVSPDPKYRAAVREALGKIDPDWKKRPDNSAVMPAMLLILNTMPREEADDVIESCGNLRASDGEALAGVLGGGPRGNGDFNFPEAENKYRNAVYGALERLGPKARPVVPAMARVVADPAVPVPARLRLFDFVKTLTPDVGPMVPAMVKMLGTTPQSIDKSIAFLRAHLSAAIPYLKVCLEGKEEGHIFAVIAVNVLLSSNALGNEEKKALLPGLIGCLPDPDGDLPYAPADGKVRSSLTGPGPVGRDRPPPLKYWPFLVETLTAVDPNWSRTEPEAAGKALAALAATINPKARTDGPVGGVEPERIVKFIGDAWPVARPLVPDLARLLLAHNSVGPGFSVELCKALDRIDPDWRKHPVIREIVAELVRRVESAFDPAANSALIGLGEAAVPELEKALVRVQDRYLRKDIGSILNNIRAAGKGAVLTLLKEVTDRKKTLDELRKLMASITATDPNWATQPEVREKVTGLLAELAQAGEVQRYAIVFAAVGPAAVPEALRLLGGRNPVQRGLALVVLRELGPKARDALPAVKKALKDSDARIRQAAVEAVGKISAGEEGLITVLAPSLIDGDDNVQMAAVGALQAVDSDWKNRPQAKAALALVLGNLSNSDPKRRASTLRVLEQVGPAEGVIPALEELVKGEKDPENLRRAQGLLDKNRRAPK